jgi:hypothetical protein
MAIKDDKDSYRTMVLRHWKDYERGKPSWMEPTPALKESGYIYIVGIRNEHMDTHMVANDTVRVKIGKTRTPPKQRLSQMQTGSPEELMVVDFEWFPVVDWYETYLFTRLQNRHTRREWFTMDRDELDELCEIIGEDAEYLYHGFNFWTHEETKYRGSRVEGLFDPCVPAQLNEMYRYYREWKQNEQTPLFAERKP